MRKLFLLSFISMATLMAWAEEPEINAVQLTQGVTVDWYFLSANPEATIEDGFITMNGKTYDLSQGDVETVFAYKDPTPTSLMETNQSSDVIKFIRDGQLYILRDGKTYTAQGAVVE